MTLQDYIDTLPRKKQFELAIKLAKLALPIWNDYTANNILTYRDTVVGLKHSVDRDLLQNTLDMVERFLHSKKSSSYLFKLRTKFDDPIVALQDTDWELPNEVQNAFYSIFNLLETCLGKTQTSFGEATIYVSINQAIDALQTSGLLTFDQLRTVVYDE